jgi:hypothetical protein
MSTTEAGFLGLLFPGIVTFLAGLWLTRRHWRPDIPPYSRAPFLDVALHPDRFVRDAPLHAIRGLTVVGAVLLACAAGLAVYHVLW